jgi:3-hydroxyisobutyrate dehydrogenase
MRVGFIGLGAIGAIMAERVAQAGFRLGVFARRRDRLRNFEEAGAWIAKSPADLAAGSDIVCLCVTDSDAVEDVVFGASGVAGGGAAGLIVADHSTIHPERTRVMARRLLAQAGMGWIDAPVSGGPDGARAGSLAVMAGGDAAEIAKATPVFRAFAARITHMGPVGAGQATKACNQMISAGTLAVVAEAMMLASRFGLDARRLPEAVAGGWADSALLRHYTPRMADSRFAGSTRTMVKDLDIAADLARSTATPIPVTALLLSMHRLLLLQGESDLGISGLIRLYTKEALPQPSEPETMSGSAQ